MPQEPLICCKDVGKKFCRDLKKSLWYGVKDIASDVLFPTRTLEQCTNNVGLRNGEFWANKDIGFEVHRGECLGLLGRNGAGKTTLLKLLNGLIKPDTGTITIRGNVGALIALGAGFNPILTGRENIFVNGAVLGLSKRQIRAKVDEIVAFAEIDNFIDSPVRTYSSGMQVRLGFAIAVVLIKPDILLLDEVLAVGDIGFVIKCLNAVRKLTAKCAVVFVSHNIQFVSSFCSRVIVMKDGRVTCDASEPGSGISAYLQQFPIESRLGGTGEAVFEDIALISREGGIMSNDPEIEFGSELSLDFSVTIDNSDGACEIHAYVMDQAQTPVVCQPITNQCRGIYAFWPGSHTVRIPIETRLLNAGRYSITLAASGMNGGTCLARLQGVAPFCVKADVHYWGYFVRPVDGSILTSRSDHAVRNNNVDIHSTAN